MNPVISGLVKKAEDYRLSNRKNYALAFPAVY
jgi:hypothetical protein